MEWSVLPAHETAFKKHVLIVEDSQPVLNHVNQQVQKILHLPTITATTIAETAEILIRQSDDIFVALLDLVLPDGADGEVVDLVVSYGIPTIVFTSRFDDDMREQILAKDVIDYILKNNIDNLSYAIRLIHQLHHSRGKKALVVDDSSTSRKYITKLLSRLLIPTYEAPDGETALALLDQHHDISLVLVDQNMPGMSGTELLTKIRKRYLSDQLCVIGISGYGDIKLSVEFIKNGANDFIAKPFTSEQFNWRIIHNLEMLDYIRMARDAAIRDHLTGLYNRKFLFEIGEKFYKNAHGRGVNKLNVAMIDIDHFKTVNDTHGHQVGDMALKHVAALLQKGFRDGDMVARYGGEEFCVLQVSSKADEGHVSLERVRLIIEQSPFNFRDVYGEHSLQLTVSIGLCNGLSDSFVEMIHLADEQLYVAKRSGRNCLCSC